MARSSAGRSSLCSIISQVWGQCSLLSLGGAYSVFWSSWPLKEETRMQRRSCILGCLIDLLFLPSYPEGFREMLGVSDASGARLEPGAGAHSPLSTLNSRLQEKNIYFHSSTSRCLLYPDNSESLQGHFRVATHCIIAQVFSSSGPGSVSHSLPRQSRWAARCHCTQTHLCLPA